MELIKITGQNGKQAVSARELYDFLGYTKAHWAKWYRKNIEENEFSLEGVDYQTLTLSVNGNETKDFALCIDFAKKLSMMARTEKGEIARKYFLECEEKYKTEIIAYQNDPFIQLRVSQIDQQKKINELESKVHLIEAKTTTRPDYFSVMGYAILNEITIGLHLAASIGRKASSICKTKGYPMDEVPDPRFGRVKLYPQLVLQQVFSEVVV